MPKMRLVGAFLLFAGAAGSVWSQTGPVPTNRVITEADSTGQVLRRHVLVPLEDEEVLAGTMSQLIDEAVLSHSRLA